MADTFTQLVARVRSMIPDADGDFVTATDLGTYINEAYFDLADRLECVTREFTGTTSGNTIALPPTGSEVVKRVQSLRVDGADVVFVDDAEWNSFADTTDDPGFVVGRVFAGSVELYPTPATGTDYSLRVVIVPETLAGSDVHELPIWCERKMIDFGAYRSFVKMDEMRRAENFIATYEQGLPAPTIGKDRDIPGPLTIVPIVGPFDLDPDAKHI